MCYDNIMKKETKIIKTSGPKYSHIDRDKKLSELINEDDLKFNIENKKKIKPIKKKPFISCSDCELFEIQGTKEGKPFGKCKRQGKCIHL